MVALSFLGCGDGPAPTGLGVTNAWARPRSVPVGPLGVTTGTQTAVYLEIHNGDTVPHRLLGGHSEVAGFVEVHETVFDGDVARMQRLNGLDLPVGETIRMSPGGVHIMLRDLRRSLEPGDTLSLSLQFSDSPPTLVLVPVLDMGGVGG